jgi:hypothetical protein
MGKHDSERVQGFSDVYGRLLQEFAAQVSESRATYGQPSRSVREEIVRCIWFGGHFPTEGLTTDDGRRLEVVSPGWWNVEGGPDFVRAEFLLEGSGRVAGDVEVHTVASAWNAHGHQQQPEYNDVALHVVLWNDRDEPVRTHEGRAIPQLTLSRFIAEDLEELVEIVDGEDEPAPARWPAPEGRYCGRAWRAGDIDAQWLGRLLDAAGDHRVVTRAAGFRDLFQNHPREQVLYERIAEALGYKNNRMPFMQLAGLLPIQTLRGMVPEAVPAPEKARLLGAALLTTAGLMDEGDPQGPAADERTVAYCREVARAWQELNAHPPAARLSLSHWHLGGTRPVNYPMRRIAGLAALCGRHLHDGLFAHFLRVVNTVQPAPRARLNTALRNALLDEFLSLRHPYWSYHYTLGGATLTRPKALVGRERATAILIDVLLPMLLAHAEEEGESELAGKLHTLWRGLPRRPDNAITRRMEQVIFESREAARTVVNSTRRQQGLHQLYRDCCRTETGCERCVAYLARRAGKTLAGV